jgi:hypothetical protein
MNDDKRRKIWVLPTLMLLERSSSTGRSSGSDSRSRIKQRELMRSKEESWETRQLLLPPRQPPMDLSVSAWGDEASVSSIRKLLLRLALRLLLLRPTVDIVALLIVQWHKGEHPNKGGRDELHGD